MEHCSFSCSFDKIFLTALIKLLRVKASTMNLADKTLGHTTVVKILNIGTQRSEQTVQTQIRQEEPGQGSQSSR